MCIFNPAEPQMLLRPNCTYNNNNFVQQNRALSEATKAVKAENQAALAKIPDHDTDAKQQVLKQIAQDWASSNQHRVGVGQAGKGTVNAYACYYCGIQKSSFVNG